MKKANFENFSKRFCAYLIDVLLLTIFFLILSVINRIIGLFSPVTFAIIGYIISVLYFAIMESGEYQATLGKRILGLMVVRSDTGEPLTLPRAIVRQLLRLLNTPIYCLGYLLVLFTKKHQGLHDLLVHSTVVDASYEDENEEEEN